MVTCITFICSNRELNIIKILVLLFFSKHERQSKCYFLSTYKWINFIFWSKNVELRLHITCLALWKKSIRHYGINIKERIYFFKYNFDLTYSEKIFTEGILKCRVIVSIITFITFICSTIEIQKTKDLLLSIFFGLKFI